MIDLIDESDIKVKCVQYTDDELLEFMIQFWEENGRPPTHIDFSNSTKYPSYATYQKRFGSWNNALEKARLDVTKGGVRLYTDSELLQYLVQFWEENGIPPTHIDFSNSTKYPSYTTYQRRFGSWNKALKLVGLDIDTMVRKGILGNNNYKGRLFEIYVLEHFIEEPVDVSGDSRGSPFDGICPNGKIYDARSASLKDGQYWPFSLNKRGRIDFYFLGAFDKDYKKLLHVWRIPENFIDGPILYIGLDSNYTYNVENMKEYEITEKFKKYPKNIFK